MALQSRHRAGDVTRDDMIKAIERLVAEEMASAVDANDKPIIGQKGRRRAQRLTERLLAQIEASGFEITPVF